MYAAAGGASLASRARKKQQKQNKNQRLQQQQNKLPTNRHFQNYTEPKIVLSRVERNALRAPSLPPEARRHSTSHPKEPSRARIKESPSVLIPIQNHLQGPVTPSTLVQDLHPSCSIQSQLPQVLMPPEGEDTLERRCSFVRQVEEMEKCHEGDLLDRCNHLCNFEIKDKQAWDNSLTYYSEFHRSAFGSLDYPFSEARAKIHDSSYGGESEEDIFAVYHQSAAANALLYVGLGTTAIGSVVFFVGSGDKGFKTLELRLIGPTLVACGLLCCLIRILLCACPSTCLRRRKKTRLKNVCPHSGSRLPLPRDKTAEFVALDPTTSLISKQKKRVSIAQQKQSKPSTSTAPEGGTPRQAFDEEDDSHHDYRLREDQLTALRKEGYARPPTIPVISEPDFAEFNSGPGSGGGSPIELHPLELTYELESVSSGDSEAAEAARPSKLTRTRVPVHTATADTLAPRDSETCLSVVVERNSECSCAGNRNTSDKKPGSDRTPHTGILLSPLQLEH